MHKVKYHEKTDDIYAIGTLHIDTDMNEIYMLCEVTKEDDGDVFFVAICLNDGTYWEAMSKRPQDAVAGLRFYSDSAIIDIQQGE